jgi:hypothetical protein
MTTEQNDNQDYVIIWEAPKLEKPEFRLYYDEKGHVITYTCEKLDGNYIIIDAMTFAQARPDVRVVDGKLSTVAPHAVITKLMPDKSKGRVCAMEDISVVVSSKDPIKKQKWKLNIYEIR